jgi:hypothetical protein
VALVLAACADRMPQPVLTADDLPDLDADREDKEILEWASARGTDRYRWSSATTQAHFAPS